MIPYRPTSHRQVLKSAVCLHWLCKMELTRKIHSSYISQVKMSTKGPPSMSSMTAQQSPAAWDCAFNWLKDSEPSVDAPRPPRALITAAQSAILPKHEHPDVSAGSQSPRQGHLCKRNTQFLTEMLFLFFFNESCINRCSFKASND